MPMQPSMERKPYKQQDLPTDSATWPAVTHGTKYVMMQMPQLLKQPNNPFCHSPILWFSENVYPCTFYILSPNFSFQVECTWCWLWLTFKTETLKPYLCFEIISLTKRRQTVLPANFLRLVRLPPLFFPLPQNRFAELVDMFHYVGYSHGPEDVTWVFVLALSTYGWHDQSHYGVYPRVCIQWCVVGANSAQDRIDFKQTCSNLCEFFSSPGNKHCLWENVILQLPRAFQLEVGKRNVSTWVFVFRWFSSTAVSRMWSKAKMCFFLRVAIVEKGKCVKGTQNKKQCVASACLGASSSCCPFWNVLDIHVLAEMSHNFTAIAFVCPIRVPPVHPFWDRVEHRTTWLEMLSTFVCSLHLPVPPLCGTRHDEMEQDTGHPLSVLFFSVRFEAPTPTPTHA